MWKHHINLIPVDVYYGTMMYGITKDHSKSDVCTVKSLEGKYTAIKSGFYKSKLENVSK